MKEEKNKLEGKLLLKRQNAWDSLKEGEIEKVFDFSEGYKRFLDISRTERLCASEIVRIALLHGFKIVGKDSENIEGDKLIFTNQGKNVALVCRGTEPVENVVNIICSHIDSPWLHLKQITVSEDENSGTVVFKTHYYGGTEKYPWLNRPLALLGVVVTNNKKVIPVSIGLDKQDPVFVIPNLLPHLARKVQAGKLQVENPIADPIPGEKLCALAGSIPIEDKEVKQRIKLNVLNILNEKYGINEEDLISSELMLVSADDIRDVGGDRSMITGPGHDDKSCAFASLRAMGHITGLNKTPEKTSAIFFFDKEEIGSEGDTGANSNFLEYVLASVQGNASILENLKMLRNSRFISADVGAGVNPNWPEPHDMMNAAKIGYGVCVTKFTGSGGKYHTNDASAETVAHVKNILNKNKITWQYEELGKVDEGGGGTIAMIFARRGMRGIDVGLSVMSMHAPSEIISKVDLYETYRFYKAFLMEG